MLCHVSNKLHISLLRLYCRQWINWKPRLRFIPTKVLHTQECTSSCSEKRVPFFYQNLLTTKWSIFGAKILIITNALARVTSFTAHWHTRRIHSAKISTITNALARVVSSSAIWDAADVWTLGKRVFPCAFFRLLRLKRRILTHDFMITSVRIFL